MAKRKAALVPPEGRNLEALAETLRSVGISAEEVLLSAIEGEVATGRLSGSIRPDDPASMDRRLEAMGIRRDPTDRKLAWPGRRFPWDALRSYPHAIFSPTLAALVWYAKVAAMPRWSTDEADETPRRGVNYEDTTPALHFLKRIGTALLPPRNAHPLWRREKALEALALAREVAKEADRIAEARHLEDSPLTIALRRVAKAHGTTPAGLKKRIERARKAHPAEDWPKKKARRL